VFVIPECFYRGYGVTSGYYEGESEADKRIAQMSPIKPLDKHKHLPIIISTTNENNPLLLRTTASQQCIESSRRKCGF
jgi:hypothetical protein